MNDYKVLEIPVTRHVRKYLEYTFGKCYVFSSKDFLGRILCGVLQKGIRYKENIKADTVYIIKISKDNDGRIGDFIEWENVCYLNKGIDDVFRRQLYFLMDHNRKFGLSDAKTTMLQVLKEINITEDDFDSASFYRDYMRKKRYKKTNRQKIFLSSSV